METPDRYNLTYRATETQTILNWISAGQCGCIIGLHGAGKSNFVQALLRQGVQAPGHEPASTHFTVVHLDLLSLLDHSTGAVYELILDRLWAHLEASDPKGSQADALATQHHSSVLAAQRAIEQCITRLLEPPTRKLVLLFDEFDYLFADGQSALFRTLRALRDAHKGRLLYIIVVRNSLTYLRRDVAEVEHFYRLVNRNVCGLGPYNDSDARAMLAQLAAERTLLLTAAQTADLIRLCGGHAGLLKAAVSLIWQMPYKPTLESLNRTLRLEPAIRAECQQIWDSLPETEQTTLRAVANGTPARNEALTQLTLKGLLRPGPSVVIFSPLLAEFVKLQLPQPGHGLHVDSATGQVHINGRFIASLHGLPLETLCYLADHRGHLCRKDEIMQSIYHQRFEDRAGDQTLQKLISRIRKEIEPDPARPRYILTVRAEGYKLVDPDIH